MKKCPMCFTEKPITEFNTINKSSTSRGGYCKSCHSVYYKAYFKARTEAKAKYDVQSKVCRDCGLEKPISQFCKRESSLDKHNIYCRPCWTKRTMAAKKRMKNG
jgi:hypothetical protein